MRIFEDLVGQKFGRLTVAEQLPRTGKLRVWRCRCDCGELKDVITARLRNGNVKSCGCYRRARGVEHGRTINRKHGEGSNGHESAEYQTWGAMLSRCNNPNHVMYPDYGARGIKVCERWRRFENFLADVGRRPPGRTGDRPTYSIDRIDNDGDYEPGNVRWATHIEQNNNQRSRRFYTRAKKTISIGSETRTLTEWLDLRGVARATYYSRIRAGLSPQDALVAGDKRTGKNE